MLNESGFKSRRSEDFIQSGLLITGFWIKPREVTRRTWVCLEVLWLQHLSKGSIWRWVRTYSQEINEWMFLEKSMLWNLPQLWATTCSFCTIILDLVLTNFVKNFLKNIHVMDCPPKNSDLNPIEHLWDIVKRTAYKPVKYLGLEDALLAEWKKIP